MQVLEYAPSSIQATQLWHHLQKSASNRFSAWSLMQYSCMAGKKERCSGVKHGMEVLVDRSYTDVAVHHLLQYSALNQVTDGIHAWQARRSATVAWSMEWRTCGPACNSELLTGHVDMRIF